MVIIQVVPIFPNIELNSIELTRIPDDCIELAQNFYLAASIEYPDRYKSLHSTDDKYVKSLEGS